ncbi:hypothetical protein BH10BAC5_BH10BAC5_17820 [soil metagenome]
MDSNLINLLKSLSETEIKNCKKFLRSPYYNSRPAVSKLFSILIKYYPLFTSPEYSKEKIFSQLHPGKKFNNLLINEYYHLLSDLIIKFLRQSLLKKNELKNDIDLLNEFSSRGLIKNYEKLFKKVEQKIKNDRFDHSILHRTYDLNTAKINARNISGLYRKNIDEIDKDYQLQLTYMINILVTEYLDIQLTYTSKSNSFNFESENLFQKIENDKTILKLYNYIKELNPFDFNIQLHIAMTKMLGNLEDEKKYLNNKELLLKNKNKLKKNELESYLNYLKAYCIRKTRSPISRNKFTNEYIGLEFFILKEKIFINDNASYLNTISFRNLLMMLVNKKDVKMLTELIEYSKFLKPEIRNCYRYLALAFNSYISEQFSEANKYLNKIITSDRQLKLDIDFLLLKIYFELKDFLNGNVKINTVRRNINNNNDINIIRKNRYRGFLNYLEKIFRLFEKKDQTSLSILFKKILTDDNVIFYEWFEEISKVYVKNTKSMKAV